MKKNNPEQEPVLRLAGRARAFEACGVFLEIWFQRESSALHEGWGLGLGAEDGITVKDGSVRGELISIAPAKGG